MARATNRTEDRIAESQVDFIVNNLSDEDKDTFLREMLMAVLSGAKPFDIVASWYETAEINADPKRKKKLLSRKKKLLSLLRKD